MNVRLKYLEHSPKAKESLEISAYRKQADSIFGKIEKGELEMPHPYDTAKMPHPYDVSKWTYPYDVKNCLGHLKKIEITEAQKAEFLASLAPPAKFGVSYTPNHKWEFHASHDSLISFEKIAENLTGNNPIALVDYGGKDKYVIVLNSLVHKSIVLDLARSDHHVSYGDNYTSFGTSRSFKDWIDWAKEVKAAPWPKEGRKNNVVKVSLPKI